VPVVLVRLDALADAASVFNLQVEEFHTYCTEGVLVLVHGAEHTMVGNGKITLTGWEGYPEGQPRPHEVTDIRLLECGVRQRPP
jgi:hypothetical protein